MVFFYLNLSFPECKMGEEQDTVSGLSLPAFPRFLRPLLTRALKSASQVPRRPEFLRILFTGWLADLVQNV